MTKRKYWHFHYGKIHPVVLGPHLRAIEMAKTARACGLEANLVVDDPSGTQIPGIRQVANKNFRFDQIQPHDAVVISDAAAARIPWFLSRRGLAFHADSYGMAIPELVKIYPSWSENDAWRDRLRRCIKFNFISRYAEQIYLSHEAQMFLLAGTVFSGRTSSDTRTTDTITNKVKYLPMGVSCERQAINLPNPYPEAIRSRPIFLWGGGIWAWFDIPTLIQSFHQLHSTNSEALLFFISADDHSGLAIHKQALETAKSLARDYGLIDKNVFFNKQSVGPSELPGYIRHAYAGVMANPDCLESAASWRSRYLDLLADGVPLVVSGRDPLANLMVSQGAALQSPAGDASKLASNIRNIASDAALRARLSEQSRRLGTEMDWAETLAPFRELLLDPTSFKPSDERPSLHWLVRYTLAAFAIRWQA